MRWHAWKILFIVTPISDRFSIFFRFVFDIDLRCHLPIHFLHFSYCFFFCCRCLLMYCLYTLFHGMGALVHSRACCPTTFVYNSNRLTMFVWCLYVIFNFFRRLFVLSAWAQSSTDFMIYRPQNMLTDWGIYFISRLFSAIVCYSCSGK